MEKVIKIGEKEVKLNNNIGWAFEYREQFGHDIIPTLMPLVASIKDLLIAAIEESDLVQEKNGKFKVAKNITLGQIAKIFDSEKTMEALIHASGLELVEFINITWALAKCADDSIPEPRIWVREFEEFPIDEIAVEVVPLIWKGVISQKNSMRLQSQMNLKPEK